MGIVGSERRKPKRREKLCLHARKTALLSMQERLYWIIAHFLAFK